MNVMLIDRVRTDEKATQQWVAFLVFLLTMTGSFGTVMSNNFVLTQRGVSMDEYPKKWVDSFVRPEGDPVTFELLIHCSNSPKDRMLPPEFYSENRSDGSVPQGTHFEIEILSPAVWDLEEPVHWHRGQNGSQRFVCWVGDLSTIDAVVAQLSIWCLGTVYTMDTGEDFAVVLHGEEFNGNVEAFIRYLCELGYDVSPEAGGFQTP